MYRCCHLFSFIVLQYTIKEMDSLNVNNGPALVATNRRPENVNEILSISPVGVSFSVLLIMILESENTGTIGEIIP